MTAITCTVTDSLGVVSATSVTASISSSNDGSSGAPFGPAQYPHLLDINSPGTQPNGLTLLARPPWNVAGVDYAVGIDRSVYPTNASLKNPFPGGISNAGLDPHLKTIGSYSGDYFGITTVGAVMDGYDFTTAGASGVCIVVFAPNVTISNCIFKTTKPHGTSLPFSAPAGSAGLLVTKCILDGSNIKTDGFSVFYPQDSCTFQYNWIKNSFSPLIQTLVAQSVGPILGRWNLLDTAGLGYASGAHGDIWQAGSGSAGVVLNSIISTYNTIYQNAPSTVAETQGINFCATGGERGSMNYGEYSNNTYVMAPNANTNYLFESDTSFVNSTTSLVKNNYISAVNNGLGPNTYWAYFGQFNGGPFKGMYHFSGNINMNTGLAMGDPQPSSSDPTRGWTYS